MGFLAPSLLLGLLAAVLPAVVHRIGRRRALVRRFAAMELLLAADREISARRRLRDVGLLVARTALAAALPIIFAQPFRLVPSDVPASVARPQAAVLVLDDSASTRRRLGDGGTAFEAIVRRARDLVRAMAPSSELALVLASDRSLPPVGELTTDRGRIAAGLDRAVASARTADVGASIARATQILAATDKTERVIYVVSDGQAAGWSGEPPPVGEAAPALVVIDASDGPWRNRAIVDVDARPAGSGGVIEVNAEIANFDSAPASAVPVTLRVEGHEVARGLVDVPAGGRARKRFSATVARGQGQHVATVEVELGEDGSDPFALDDRRSVLVSARSGLRALVSSGDPRTVRTEDETFFVETALRSASPSFDVVTVLPEDLDHRDLDEFAIVVLANSPAPSAESAARLRRFVVGGGGLFIAVGDRVDPDAWNARLGDLLPQPLGMPRTAAARAGAGAEAEVVDTRPAERLAPFDRAHPVVAVFPSSGAGLASARFFKYLLLGPLPDSADRRVVARYESGAPALVEADVGQGRVLLLSTSLDRDWTDLPIRAGFVPLIGSIARRLAGDAAPIASSEAHRVGQARDLNLRPDDAVVEIKRPDGRVDAFRGTEIPRPGPLRFAGTDEPGVYRVAVASQGQAMAPRPSLDFVVTLDASESDPAPRATTHASQPGSRGAPGSGAPPMRKVELWHLLAMAIVGLIALESALTIRRRSRG